MRRPVVSLAVLLAALGAATADAARPAPAKPAFTSYAAPDTLGQRAGEPTLGRDPESGAVLFQSGTQVLRVTGFAKGGKAEWRSVGPLVPGLYTFDPILETDERTGRAWTSQLDLYCSRMAFTDDAGTTWTQVPLGCGAGAMFDHQTVGHGPFREGGIPRLGSYPNAVYYCAQTVVTAMCSASGDGGLTFLPARPAWHAGQCTGLFGHLKSAPDGIVYLPAYRCGARAGLGMSADNGQTWTVRTVPDSTVGDAMHPSLDTGADGTLYFAWGGDDAPGGASGPPYAAVSRDGGATWTRPVRLGGEHRIANTRFVTTVAGDGDRAAVAFLGTPTAGNGSEPAFAGVWRAYVAYTYDRGRTWSTVVATPESPVQVGAICSAGTTCTANRNLLDFIDAIVDERGNVLVAIADGCLGATCTTANRSAKATILRQTAGRGLLRKWDRR